jgi:hypothetical protein
MSIEAMKQALEALEEVQKYDKTSEWFDKKVSALRQAIAEAEKQEPVEFPVVHEVRCTYPQCQATNGCVGVCSKTAPLKREWVGLTDHELQVLDFNDPERGKLARAVEAKLKERNT